MRGKVARQLRDLCNYKDHKNTGGIRKPELLVVRTEKAQKFILDPNGEMEVDGIRFNWKEYDHDVTRLNADPVRQVYQDLKQQWYGFTKDDHKRVQSDSKENE